MDGFMPILMQLHTHFEKHKTGFTKEKFTAVALEMMQQNKLSVAQKTQLIKNIEQEKQADSKA